jgi:hypothetical protein
VVKTQSDGGDKQPGGDGSKDRSRLEETNRPISISQEQRFKQRLRAMKQHKMGLHRPNESIRMRLFTAVERIWWGLIKEKVLSLSLPASSTRTFPEESGQ